MVANACLWSRVEGPWHQLLKIQRGSTFPDPRNTLLVCANRGSIEGDKKDANSCLSAFRHSLTLTFSQYTSGSCKPRVYCKGLCPLQYTAILTTSCYNTLLVRANQKQMRSKDQNLHPKMSGQSSVSAHEFFSIEGYSFNIEG